MIPAAPSDVTSLFSQSQLGIDTRCPDPIIKRSEAVFCGMPLSACNSLIEQPTQNDEKKWLLMAASWEKLAANVSRDEEVIKASLVGHDRRSFFFADARSFGFQHDEQGYYERAGSSISEANQ